jgi:hypothetical protein
VDRSPELLALVDDFARGAENLSRAEAEFKKLKAERGGDDPSVGLAALYHRSLHFSLYFFPSSEYSMS